MLKITKGICTILVGMAEILTVGLHALTKLGLHFPVGPVASLLYKFSRHGGGSDDRFEAALAFGHVLLRVEEDDVDFGHVEHPQRHRRAEAERDGEGGGLDVHLETTHIRWEQRERESQGKTENNHISMQFLPPSFKSL